MPLPPPLSVEPREPQHSDERRLREEKADSDAGNREHDGGDAVHLLLLSAAAFRTRECSRFKSSVFVDSNLLSIGRWALTEP